MDKKTPDRATMTPPVPVILGRLGSLDVYLTTNEDDLRAAQKLRYQVFYEEMSACGNEHSDLISRVDVDEFDRYCDHLIVVDRQATSDTEAIGGGKIVGTYRLLRQDIAEQNAGFYSQGEYDVAALIRRHPKQRFLELGRSCVLKPYRTKRTVELLWHGIWTYVLHHKIDVMFGCASLEGTDPGQLQDQLSLLSNINSPPNAWRARAHDHHRVPMQGNKTLPHARTMASLPPLIKGYLRLGAYVGDGAVIDKAFGTTDVLIILPVENINPRYVNYYGGAAERHAA